MPNLYTKFIKPASKEPDQAEREIVLNYLLLGIIGLSFIALADALLQLTVSQDKYLFLRIIVVVLSTAFFVTLYVAARWKNQVTLVATVLTAVVTLAACLIIFQWGLLLPTGIALFSLSIVMAGILISARYSFYTASLIAVFMAVLQSAQATGHWHPDRTWMKSASTGGDVIGFAAIFFIIALVSWIFNRQMELSLRRAWKSEQALLRQKALLEIKVERRAQELEAAQLEKMRELYRFAELGRLSTALFHDLANHLSSVSLEIEGLSGKKGQSDIMERISQNVGHIDTIVQRVRQQLRGKSVVEIFDVKDEITEVIKILTPAAQQARVEIKLAADPSVRAGLSYKGDPIRFRQIILNLISNSLESYPEDRKQTPERSISIELSRQKSELHITVADHGMGVAKKDRDKIFRPFYTTKDKGVGIGLFIVSQVVQNDFHGTIELLRSDSQGTVFEVILPKSYYAKNRP